jgi:polyphosphate glucokinase
VLVIDIGGSGVKVQATGHPRRRRFKSGPMMTPQAMVGGVLELTRDWKYDVISLGYPGAVGHDGPVAEPGNLAPGWVKFDFAKAFGKPVRMVNDAAMQALGAYRKTGRMLFLGLGTGLGSALVADRVLVPLELGCVPYNDRESMFERLGKAGLKRRGKKSWRKSVYKAVELLREITAADHITLGGGNADLIDPLPADTRRGSNRDAFVGGVRLWEELLEHHDLAPSAVWRVVR